MYSPEYSEYDVLEENNELGMNSQANPAAFLAELEVNQINSEIIE